MTIRLDQRRTTLAEDWPTCGWYDKEHERRCDRRAAFIWGTRMMCANHAASWLRLGKTMVRMPFLQNPYPGSNLFALQTRVPEDTDELFKLLARAGYVYAN